MALQCTQNLPFHILKTYEREGVSLDAMSCISNGRANGVEFYDIEFHDGTEDSWEWKRNPKSKDPIRFPKAWIRVLKDAPIGSAAENGDDATIHEEVTT